MTDQIKLTVLGEPQAQKRHRHANRGGRIMQYDPSASDKGDFLSMVQKNAPATPLLGPLSLSVSLYFKRPKAHYRTGKNSHILKDDCPSWHTSKPDADNGLKLIQDALNGVFFKDDSQICHVNIAKLYSTNPRTEIILSRAVII